MPHDALASLSSMIDGGSDAALQGLLGWLSEGRSVRQLRADDDNSPHAPWIVRLGVNVCVCLCMCMWVFFCVCLRTYTPVRVCAPVGAHTYTSKSLDNGVPLARLAHAAQEAARTLGLLSAKPLIYLANVSEQQLFSLAEGSEVPPLHALRQFAAAEGAPPPIPINAILEHKLLASEPEGRTLNYAPEQPYNE
jgi:hypothetical protein